MSPKTTPSAERPSADRLAVLAGRAMVSLATLAKGAHGIVRRIQGERPGNPGPECLITNDLSPSRDGSVVQRYNLDSVSEPTAGLNWRYRPRLEHRAGLLRFPEYRIRNWCRHATPRRPRRCW